MAAEAFRPEYLRPSQAERERAEFLRRVTIAGAEKADFSAVAALEREIFTQPWSEESLRSFYEKEGNRLLCACENGRVIGYCGYYSTGEEANVTNLAVAEAYRGKGIGHLLLSYAIREAARNGQKAMTLEVRVSNMAARNLYESLDFKMEGCRKQFYADPAEDACIYWLRDLQC